MNRAAIGVLLLRVVGAAMTYVFVAGMARIMLVPDFGVMGTVFSASLLLSVFASWGQQQALVRFLPPLLREGRQGEILSLVRRALQVVVIGNLSLWFVLLAGVFVAAALGLLDRPGVLALGLVIIPLTGLVDFQAYLARAHKLVILAVVPKDIAWRLVSLVVLYGFAISGQGTVGLQLVFLVLVAVLAVIVVTTVALGPRIWGLPRSSDVLAARDINFDEARWRASNFPFWVTSVSAAIFTNVDVLIVAALLGPESAGLYFAANRIAQAPGFFQQSYNVVVSPIFAEHAAAGETAALRRATLQATILIFLPTIALSFALAVFAEQILAIFGPDFRAASTALQILLAARVLNVAFGPADLLLPMSGHERIAMWISIWTTVSGVGVVALGIYFGGVDGGAVGVLVSMIGRKVWFWLEAMHRVRVRSDVVAAAQDLVTRRSA